MKASHFTAMGIAFLVAQLIVQASAFAITRPCTSERKGLLWVGFVLSALCIAFNLVALSGVAP